MMRKLAVTVFALSLAALGCGSDSGTKTTPDTGVGAEAGHPSVDSQIADAPIGAETQVPLDTAKVDVQVVDAPQVLDQAPAVDVPAIDTPKAVDGPGIDSTKPVLDGGVDSQPKVDTGSALDEGSVDASSNG
jgi:hypothetical protein